MSEKKFIRHINEYFQFLVRTSFILKQMFFATLTCLHSFDEKYFVRLGQLHLNSGGMCPDRLRKDLEFWQISEFLLGEASQLAVIKN